MKFNFFSKTIPAFGLDVSGGAVKFVELSLKGNNASLKSYSEALLPKNVIVADVVTDQKTFDYVLKQHLQKPQFGRITTNYVTASLPESKSFVRVIQIPKMSESEAENAVPYEAESFIPLPLDQVYLDWQILGKAEGVGTDGQEKMSVLMVASPKEFVDGFLSLLDKSGLKTVGLEVESQSCHRAVLAQGSKETMLLVDIDEYRSNMIMVEDGDLQFTSTVPIAGSSFTDSIARSLGVSTAKAEEIKRKVGIGNTAEYPNIKTSFLPVLANLSAEIKNILKFHNERSTKQATRILLLGGAAKLKNLAEFLGPELADTGAKVELANPWLGLGPGASPLFDPFEALSYTTAIGLAMRGAKFTP